MKQISTHNLSSGMSFLEIMIVLVLIGVMGAVIAPNISSYFSKRDRLEFEVQFEEFINQAKQHAILTGKVHQIFFDFQNRKIFTKIYDASLTDQTKHNRFVRFGSEAIELGADFALQNFFIQGNDEVRFGETKETAWFYIMPDGSSQDIIINFTYGDDNKERGIKINPFYVRVNLYDAFQYP